MNKRQAVYGGFTPSGRPLVIGQNGQDIAELVLSGYRMGRDLSPVEWRDRIVEGVNAAMNLTAPECAALARILLTLTDGQKNQLEAELTAIGGIHPFVVAGGMSDDEI